MKGWIRCAVVVGIFASTLSTVALFAADKVTAGNTRERLTMDFGWRFALGHPYDPQKDFGYSTAYFFFAKAGYGDGPASVNFDDRTWRMLNLPHDWAVELPFDPNTNGNHGSKAIGRNFPQNDVGWYRKTFTIPASDVGRRIGIDFDGVYRDSVVWINGHYLGTEHSGYTSFHYDLTNYLNYGGENVIAVRADATIEEGWFYEGAGIYRHVWLTKTALLHVATDGTFVTSDLHGDSADVKAAVSVQNDGTSDASFEIRQTIVDTNGASVVAANGETTTLKAGASADLSSTIRIANPALWSIETPSLYTLVTTIDRGGQAVDRYETPFGIRSIRFDPNHGFFLNGKHVELKGTNNHQDHAGVGNAVPDSLLEYRIRRLKEMGSNAYRTSHNPPAPELLAICDRLGMLVLDEHRMMGTTPEILDELKGLVLRDRNHPSVILWSVGNEEWALEWKVTGERLTAAMQAFVTRLDPTRRATVALSGSGEGNSLATDVLGFNYYRQHDIDKMHARFPDRPIVGTEESSSTHTRGIYVDDDAHQHLSAYDNHPGDHHSSIEEAWNFHLSRPFSAGVFFWTGFDYRGEPTPFGWPAISSQFGLLDTCGFFKDTAYLAQSWWSDKPVVHLLPHWNWPGKEGLEIDVQVYSNADEVELFLNRRSLGRKPMPRNSHLEWKVRYQPGTLLARGFKEGKVIGEDKRETTGQPAAIELTANKTTLNADDTSVSVITVRVSDAGGSTVPTASNEVVFKLEGPGKILGVGNGDPSSHEPDQFLDQVSSLAIDDWRVKTVEGSAEHLKQPELPEGTLGFDDSSWQKARFEDDDRSRPRVSASQEIYRGTFDASGVAVSAKLTLILRSLGDEDTIYLNGAMIGSGNSNRVAGALAWNKTGHEVDLVKSALRPGKNAVAILTTHTSTEEPNRRALLRAGIGSIRVVVPEGEWKRSVFNGLAEVIVQSARTTGEITLTATSTNIAVARLKIRVEATSLLPASAKKQMNETDLRER